MRRAICSNARHIQDTYRRTIKSILDLDYYQRLGIIANGRIPVQRASR